MRRVERDIRGRVLVVAGSGRNLSAYGFALPTFARLTRIRRVVAIFFIAASLVHNCVPGVSRQDAIRCASVRPMPFA
jgi:hypothetical protein